jgi:hypothetical protein
VGFLLERKEFQRVLTEMTPKLDILASYQSARVSKGSYLQSNAAA